MGHDDTEHAGHALARWQDAEAAYHAAAAPFLGAADDPPAMSKDELIELISLREKADRWRERFFKRQVD